MYADDVEPGVAFYAALGFEESYRYALQACRCMSSFATAG